MDSDSFLQPIIDALTPIPGIQVIVLGGSRARGTHSPSSDYDIGIYYDPAHPLDIAALSEAAARLDDTHRAELVTPNGGWGPWINGGGWLKVQSIPVDLIYRDLDKVQAVITNCLAGQVTVDYQAGHPFGFVSSIYLAETAVCLPLWDPNGVVARLKEQVIPYPDALQTALITKFAWEIDFSIQIAKKSVERADVVYAAGCCFRAVMCALQVLFALNKEYWLNEKGAVKIASGFAVCPDRFAERAQEVFRLLEASPASIQQAVTILQGLNADIERLVHYRSAGFTWG